MASEVFEDVLDLEIGLLEATLPNWKDRGARNPSYPLPSLTPIPRKEIRRFRTLLLENPFLRACVLPALGGRVLNLLDKRTGKEILSKTQSLQPVPGGLRGAVLRDGLQIRYVGGEDRLNAMGNVDAAADDAGVWVAESAMGPLGYHLHLVMPEDRAELSLEIRFFNRSLTTQPYNGAVTVYMPGAQALAVESGVTLYDGRHDAGLAFFWDEPMAYRLDDGALTVSRFSGTGSLGGRQLDTLKLRLIPISGLGGLSGSSAEGAVCLSEDGVRVQVTERRPNHKLLLVTDDGQTLEATVDLYPEHAIDLPLNGLRPLTVVLRDPGKRDVLRFDRTPVPEPPSIEPVLNPPTELSTASTREELRRATFEVGKRAIAHTLLGMGALAHREFTEASEQFERALLYNAEDHLTWWLKSFADRSRGEEGERAELLNAHYLAPLEPVLRAEAFLTQDMSQGKEPNPLVAPLAENPESLVEVACLLLEAGLLPEANRWIDEALRHRDLPILHILQAFALRQGTRMEAEVARHLTLAKGLTEPPFPWRDIEWKAIEALGL